MKTVFSLVLCALLSNASTVKASEAVLSSTGGAPGYVFGTGGWSFEPLTPVSVTSLGCFDFALVANGQLAVGLWGSDGSLLASTGVTPTSPLVNLSRYEPITPVNLTPGFTYYIGAYSGSGTTFLAGIADDLGTVTLAPEIQLGMATVGYSGFNFPSTPIGDAGSMLLAPNFQFVAVPEPNGLALLCLGAGSLIAARQFWSTRKCPRFAPARLVALQGKPVTRHRAAGKQWFCV